jgi:3-oxoacyl-[acyl-carrier protein] reductase
MRRQLSVELGPHGIRVVTLESGGVPESMPQDFEGREEIVEMLEKQRCSAVPPRSRKWVT